MAPVKGSIETSPPSFTPPIAEPAPKDQKTMRVELVAIPIITAVAAFMLLSLQAAFILTAIVTVGAVMYLRREKPAEAAKPAATEETPTPNSPEAPSVVASKPLYKPKALGLDFYDPPRPKGVLGGVMFRSIDDAKAFQKACEQYFQDLIYDYYPDEPTSLYFSCKPNLDAKKISKELRDFIEIS